MAYVDLVETNGTVVSVAKNAITVNSASTIMENGRLVLAYRDFNI